MKLLRRLSSIVLAFIMSVSICGHISYARENPNEFKGFFVNSYNNVDFPSDSNLSVRALTGEINEIIKFAKANNFNSLIFEARPDDTALYKSKIYPTSDFWLKEKGDFSFFDISKAFIKRAAKESINLFALVNLGFDVFEDEVPEDKIEENLDDLRNLSSKYKFSGIILKGLPSPEEFDHSSFLNDAKNSVGEKPLGVFLELGSEEGNNLKPILENADFVIASVDAPLEFRNHGGYIEKLNSLKKINPNIIVYSDIEASEDVTATISTKHFEALNAAFDDFAFNGYSALKDNKNMQLSLLSEVYKMKEPVDKLDTGYVPTKNFDLTRPVENISTPYSSYFIMGTSNPDYPVYHKGQKIERFGEDGLWGVQEKLSIGNNYFSFAQNGVTKSVVIRRYSAGGGSPSLINKITKAFPWDNAVFKSGEEQTISCIAPAGGRVTAKINGKWIGLEQAAQAQRGVPALYKGKVTLDDAEAGEVKSIGTIDYNLTFNGVNSVYTTKGEVYLAGENSHPRVRTDIIFANVLTPDLEFGDFKSIYKEGTTEEIVDMAYANNDWYYELASGGFIKAADVEVLESDSIEPPVSLSECEFMKEDNKEKIIIKNAAGLPYFFDEKDDGSTVLSLFGNFNSEDMEYFKTFLETNESTHFSSIKLTPSEKGIDITFVPFDKDEIWGLDVIYEGNDSVIFSKSKPELSDDVLKPLSNLTVAIDPGHGGIDSGAPGVLSAEGPMEKHANLSNALILKERLEMLGAKVVLTRETNEENPTLLERANTAYLNDADIFMSLHHNSIVEAADGNEYKGVEAYHYEDFGKHLAELIPQKISENNAGREFRKTEYAYYVVTKIRCAPALLCEIGFMPSPYEYERVCEADEIFKTAEAVTASILEFMQ